MGLNLNSREARIEFEFLKEEAKNLVFDIIKVNMNKTTTGKDVAKLFCKVSEGEHKDKVITHELFWTEKNAFRIREFALICFPSETKRDELNEEYQHTHVEYPADFITGRFRADFLKEKEDSEFKRLKNITSVI